MPIDSWSQRASAIQFGLPWVMALPEPDGTVDQNDRQHLGMSFTGISSSPPTAGSVPAATMPLPAAIPTRTPQVFIVIEDIIVTEEV